VGTGQQRSVDITIKQTYKQCHTGNAEQFTQVHAIFLK